MQRKIGNIGHKNFTEEEIFSIIKIQKFFRSYLTKTRFIQAQKRNNKSRTWFKRFINLEETFTIILQKLITKYKNPILASKLLSAHEIECVFSNIDSQLQIHLLFFKELNDCLISGGPSFYIRESCVSLFPQITNLIEEYSDNFSVAKSILETFSEQKKFQTLIRSVASNDLQTNQSMNESNFRALLEAPLTQLEKYLIILEKLLNYMFPERIDFMNAKNLFRCVKTSIKFIDTVKDDRASRMQLHDLIGKLEYKKKLSLSSPVLKQSHIWKHKNVKSPVSCAFCSDSRVVFGPASVCEACNTVVHNSCSYKSKECLGDNLYKNNSLKETDKLLKDVHDQVSHFCESFVTFKKKPEKPCSLFLFNNGLLICYRKRKDKFKCVALLKWISQTTGRILKLDKSPDETLLILIHARESEKHYLRFPTKEMKKAWGDFISETVKKWQFEQLSFSGGDEESNSLIEAIQINDIKKVKKLITFSSVEQLNAADSLGFTPLHVAASNCIDDDIILNLLLSVPGIQVNKTNKNGNTPFHYFCSKYQSPDCTEILNLFIEKGANINARNHLNETPLHYTILNKNIGNIILEFLIEKGVEINAVTSRNESALHYAIYEGSQGIIIPLLQAGIDVEMKNEKNKNSVQLATEKHFKLKIDILNRALETRRWLKEMNMEKYFSNFMKCRIFYDNYAEINEEQFLQLGIHGNDKEELFKYIKQPRKKSSLLSFSEAYYTLLNNTSVLEIFWDEIEFQKKIGSGSNAKVFRAIFREQVVAVKQMKARDDSQRQIEEFKKEVLALRSVKSPYVIKLLGICFKPKLVMVMEYCSNGSLFDVMRREGITFSWNRVFEFLTMMTYGLKALHDHKPALFHRDFKSLNLLVTDEWIIKLCDMGLARFNFRIAFDSLGKCCGSLCYSAPQLFYQLPYVAANDIYSFGIVLWEILNRTLTLNYLPPFYDYANIGEYGIMFQVATNNLRPVLPKNCPKSFQELFQDCVDKEVDKRPTAGILLSRIQEIEEEYTKNQKMWDQLISN